MNNSHIDSKKVPETIILSKQLPYREYTFDTFDFEIKIKSIALIVDPAIHWRPLIEQIEIWVHVSAYSMHENDPELAVKLLLPIHLFNDPYNNIPFFQLDKVIDKRLFDCHTNFLGINKFMVRIELNEKVPIEDAYDVQLVIIK